VDIVVATGELQQRCEDDDDDDDDDDIVAAVVVDDDDDNHDNHDNHDDDGLLVSAFDPMTLLPVAFGMGINRPDVRAILHWGWPQSLEQYFQVSFT
jgi:hypothetical protein